MVVELVETLGPEPPVGFDPVDRGIQRLPFQMAGAELRLATAGDQA